MKYALGSNLILNIGYGSTSLKTHVPKVLARHFSSYAVWSQKSDDALQISPKITIPSFKKKNRLWHRLVECERHLEKF